MKNTKKNAEKLDWAEDERIIHHFSNPRKPLTKRQIRRILEGEDLKISDRKVNRFFKDYREYREENPRTAKMRAKDVMNAATDISKAANRKWLTRDDVEIAEMAVDAGYFDARSIRPSEKELSMYRGYSKREAQESAQHRKMVRDITRREQDILESQRKRAILESQRKRA